MFQNHKIRFGPALRVKSPFSKLSRLFCFDMFSKEPSPIYSTQFGMIQAN